MYKCATATFIMVNNNEYINKGNSQHEVMTMSELFGYNKSSMSARINLKSKYNFVYDVMRFLKVGTILASTIVFIYAGSWAAVMGMRYLVAIVP